MHALSIVDHICFYTWIHALISDYELGDNSCSWAVLIDRGSDILCLLITNSCGVSSDGPDLMDGSM